jgi:hypothetical protein
MIAVLQPANCVMLCAASIATYSAFKRAEHRFAIRTQTAGMLMNLDHQYSV